MSDETTQQRLSTLETKQALSDAKLETAIMDQERERNHRKEAISIVEDKINIINSVQANTSTCLNEIRISQATVAVEMKDSKVKIAKIDDGVEKIKPMVYKASALLGVLGTILFAVVQFGRK